MLAYYRGNNNDSYYTIALAFKYNGLNSKIVLFNPFTQNIQIKKLWVKNNNRRIRCAYIIEEIIEETYNNWNGYKAIINDIKSKSLFGKIKFSDSSLELANELYSKIEITDWFECKNDNQLNSLKNVALDFHDSYIKKTKDLNNGKRILIDTTWDCFIELKCIDIFKYDVLFDLSFEYYSDSNLYIKDDVINIEFELGCSNDDRYFDIIQCKKLYWRIKL
ncbi:MAG TPA: hypothetical protein DCR62_02265 [Acholeplasmatales bacterium]|nr:hypothetical protein [Acholeplasmatales bacterium]